MPAGLDSLPSLPIPISESFPLLEPPPEKPKPKKRKRKEIKFLTEDELARLFSVISAVRDRAMFQLAYRAGLCASEVGMLQMRDYDPKADKIFVHFTFDDAPFMGSPPLVHRCISGRVRQRRTETILGTAPVGAGLLLRDGGRGGRANDQGLY